MLLERGSISSDGRAPPTKSDGKVRWRTRRRWRAETLLLTSGVVAGFRGEKEKSKCVSVVSHFRL